MNLKNVEEIYPLSPMQQGILFHTLYAPESGVYVEQLSCTLQGSLNLAAFQQAWQQVVDRHPILRTAFLWEKLKEPLQVVRQRVTLPWTLLDWRDRNALAQEAALHDLLAEQRRRGFALTKAPLLQVTVIRLAEERHQLVWGFHHLLLDGWSMPVVLNDLFTCYAANCQQRPRQLPQPRPYRDYIAWLQQQDLAQAEQFWRENLQGFTAPTPLVVDKPVTQLLDRDVAYRERSFPVAPAVSAALQTLAQQHHLTLSTIVQGAWALLLSRYSGERDVLFGATVSGRPPQLAGVETMVGLFINTLPVRVTVAEDQFLSPWLQALQTQQLAREAYAFTPLVNIQSWSAVERGAPLFESLVVFENYPIRTALQEQGNELSVAAISFAEQTNYPLTLLVLPGPQITLRLGYDPRRFDDAAIDRLAGHLQHLLTAMSANPNRRLLDLPLLTPAEELLLASWNATAAPYPTTACVHHLLEAQAAQQPDRVALVFGDQRLTYGELNQRANQLAHHLITVEGVGVESLVGICLERSLAMVIGLLAILKTGAAYVPLDPTYPAERLALMISDADVRVLLTNATLAPTLPVTAARLLCLDQTPAIAQQPTHDPTPAVTAANRAYVIYTSGSTGKPKGVQIEHRAVVNLLTTMAASPGLTADDVLLAVTTLSFDIAGVELYLPLLVGARIVIADGAVVNDGMQLQALLQSSGATVMQATPATWRLLLAAGWAGNPALRIWCGGEALAPKLAAQLLTRGGELWNLYGPTETTIYSTIQPITQAATPEQEPLITIGRPIANTQTYILDAHLRPTPIGVPGELYIGGDGLAHGYLNRPELTAERFIANPFAPAGRLYRTGDQARYLPDGAIDYQGRLDNQVKIRGFRIELGEIEALLGRYAGVHEAVVVARAGEGAGVDAEKQLVAYLAPIAGQALDTAALRLFVQTKLPAYMVPDAFVVLTAFPLTPNGKVNRKALPAPERAHLATAAFTAPRTPTQELVAAIWSDVLGVAQIGSQDDFFDLGGHSLAAMRVLTRLRQSFACDLNLQQLFSASTVAALSAVIDRARTGQSLAGARIPSVEPTGPHPLSFAQERLWFLEQLGGASGFYALPFTLRLEGMLNPTALIQALNAIVQRHAVLRSRFLVQNKRLVQMIDEQMTAPFTMLDWQPYADAEQQTRLADLLAAEDGQRFDLSQGPLLRATLIALGPEEHLFYLVLHHLVADGWSLGVLIEELSACYSAFVAGETPVLPPLAIQYADFAVWQRARLQGELLEKQLSYWQQQLAGAPPLLELPTDYPRPAVQQFTGALLPLTIDVATTQRLKQLGRQQDATLFMILQAAFVVLLYRYSGQEDIVIGSPIAGRTHPDLERLIGLFINTMALRTRLDGNPRFVDLLAQVRQTALAAYAHQELPFEHLVERLQPQRSLSHTPIFQVLLILQNTPLTDLTLPGLTVSPLAQEEWPAKFDLVLELIESDGQLLGSFKYNRSLFDAATIARMATHFQQLLQAILANPEQPVALLPLLSATERQHLLTELNATARIYPQERCIHHWIEAQAAATPDAPALIFDDQHLSYDELNRRANQLAHYLQTLHVGPDTLVGICAERSLAMVVGLLAILKAGGAYVPLDPTYPSERLRFMVEDAATAVLLTQSYLVERLPATQATLVCLDQVALYADQPTTNPASQLTLDQLCYMIYTSGSTGQPKGAMNTHGGILNRLLWMQEAYQLTAADRVLQKTPFSFDVSVWEFFWPLMTGACLVVAPPEKHKDNRYLVEAIVAHGITTLHFVPSMLQRFIEEPGVTACTSLRRVICSGEALPFDLQARFFARLDAELHNLYGPTEAAVDVSYWACQRDSQRGIVPIGYPIANLQLYILDPYLQPTPLGVPGELHIGGGGLARGYHKRPELTQEKFIPDPFHPAPARLYKTGDLARYLPDGAIEYLGRIDHQVKVRGFRIELGEIEAALTALPQVREAVVALREDRDPSGRGDKRLVAYLTATAAETLSITELRQRLSQSLPEYMIPAAFLWLPALPLSPNGKVDRRQLPAPSDERPALAAAYHAPATNLETMLVELWQAVLGLAQVGVDDHFFELGGDSIKGAILINELQAHLGEIIHVVAIFDAPTVSQMAAYLQQHYGPALARHFGAAGEESSTAITPLTAAAIAHFRQLIPPLAVATVTKRNPPAIFLLSPPRSGSTLLRVLLAGHPQLFAPPELELLSFPTLAARKAAFSDRDSFWLEGALRALMEAQGLNAATAQQRMAAYEAADLDTVAFYGELQRALGDRRLVDKTPSYALNPAILARAEDAFADAHYIHLLRSPYAMIHSFDAARMDQIFFRRPHPFTRRQLAELMWLVSHQHILHFLAQIPAARQQVVHFETLVQQPEATLRDLCAFLGIDFHPAMIEPYAERRQRMTDGLHPESRMVGDVKFHQHQQINPDVAESWRGVYTIDFVSEPTATLMAHFGYERLPQPTISDAPLTLALPPITPVVQPNGHQQNGVASALGEEHSAPPTLPLSFAQQRLWFLDQLTGGSANYNIPVTLHLEGSLQVAALEKSLLTVVQRHAVLRTRFPLVNGMPQQVIADEAQFHLPLVDLQALAEEAKSAQAQQLILADAQRPFDLTTGPLLRATLFRLASDEHLLLVNMHHIVADGWSIGIFLQEVSALYQAFVTGAPSPLPPLPIQYHDFARWQRTWLQGDHLAQTLAYWRAQLADAPPLLELPTDSPRPPVQTTNGRAEYFQIEQSVLAQLKALAQANGATLFMTLLAAYAVLLARWSGENDIIIGSPIAGRTRKEVEGLIGFFVNTLALRVKLTDDPSFIALLQQVRQVALDAYAHQDAPFEQLVEMLHPQRALSHHPLFQVMFVLQNATTTPATLAGLTMRPLALETVTAKFDLTLSLSENADGLLGVLEYNSDLFEAATIQRWVGHFQRLLATLAAAPQQAVATAPFLPATEREQLLLTWNATATPTDVRCIHQQVADQAARHPTALAVVAGDCQLTYGELATQANALAQQLQSLGVGPDRLVGLAVERSIDMVIALLAILKAGGIYVPLDPALPSQRLALMLADSRPTVLITQRHLAAGLPAHNAHLLCLDEWATTNASTAGAVTNAVDLQADHLAYLIYTSGSTGQPKGVAVTHGGLANVIAAQIANYQVAPGARLYYSLSLSFDAATSHIWMALASGATLCLAPQGQLLAGRELHDFLRQQQITHLPLPGALLALLPPDDLPDLRLLITGGEACSADLVQRWAPRYGFYNEYGPTETTICATVAHCLPDGRTPPIGRPLANVQLYLLDQALQPVPIGVVGELYIGGVGLARGYYGQPGFTAERFIPHPFATADTPGARLYKTGDLARYHADGQVEFVGRVDQQVKLRGFRIELGEIEAVLTQHEAVQDALVTLATDERGEKRLTAYLVLRAGLQESDLAVSAVRDFLAARLPDYMIPTAVVLLPAFPLTTSGKVDRRALPAPANFWQSETVYVAPRTAVEELLATLFGDLLQAGPIGIHDNFFDRGGHSLLATQLVARIQLAFTIELPLRTFFMTPTVADIAAIIAQNSVMLPPDDTDPLVAQLLSQVEELSEEEARRLFETQLA